MALRQTIPLNTGATPQKWCLKHEKLSSIFEGSLEVKLPTIWTNEKQRWERREAKKKEDQKDKVSEGRRSRCAKR